MISYKKQKKDTIFNVKLYKKLLFNTITLIIEIKLILIVELLLKIRLFIKTFEALSLQKLLFFHGEN